jgi:hypothetical protein
VSALIGCAAQRTYGKPLDLHVVHNPRADVPLPLGALGGEDDEWFATPIEGANDEFDLQRRPMPGGLDVNLSEPHLGQHFFDRVE